MVHLILAHLTFFERAFSVGFAEVAYAFGDDYEDEPAELSHRALLGLYVDLDDREVTLDLLFFEFDFGF